MSGEVTKTRTRRNKLRRGACKEFLQNEISTILPEAVAQLREKILSGDAGALKTLWQMSDLDKEKPRVRGRSSATMKRILKKLHEHDARERAKLASEGQEG